jgi:3D (Asp-Asp-Asp) domain-containing protein
MRVLTLILAVLLYAGTAYASTHKTVSIRNISSKQRIAATVTAYTPAPRENGGRGTKSGTAIGTRIRPGIVAVSRDLLRSGWSFGDKIHIEGLGVFTIEDTMHQRHRRTIDVAVPNMAEAEKIGKRRDIVVTLLEGGQQAGG